MKESRARNAGELLVRCRCASICRRPVRRLISELRLACSSPLTYVWHRARTCIIRSTPRAHSSAQVHYIQHSSSSSSSVGSASNYTCFHWLRILNPCLGMRYVFLRIRLFSLAAQLYTEVSK